MNVDIAAMKLKLEESMSNGQNKFTMDEILAMISEIEALRFAIQYNGGLKNE